MAATISIIAARAKNGVIGARNGLPWHLPADLKNFKRLTFGHPIVMGRKTYDSIGKPLPGRFNIVISRDAALRLPGCHVADSLTAAIDAAQAQNPKEVFVIGGAQIYALAMKLAHRLYITEIDADVEGDAFFPQFSEQEWKTSKQAGGEFSLSGEKQTQFDFVLYERE